MPRKRITIRGVVQGVGFRPFVFSLANRLGLVGWVRNSTAGVEIEVEGVSDAVSSFESCLVQDQPLHAVLDEVCAIDMEPNGGTDFEILPSDESGNRPGLILPDLATCPECLAEILDPTNRRHRHPFANCTQCGPRFSVIKRLPYDRANTSMRAFEMCAACRAEYEDPADRRFHAQPVSCPDCGPQLSLHDASGELQAGRDEALVAAVDLVREGRILALKGLGGFQLLVDARNEAAVTKLRDRKRRPTKPFAIMVSDTEMASTICALEDAETKIIAAPQAPIVLATGRSGDTGIAASVAPDNPRLGVMLPCTPLHHLLMRDLGFPVIATSGNVSDEPICIDNEEAFRDLSGIADAFLVHNRPILRAVDDSVAMVACGEPMLLRRARGYAPLPIRLKRACSAPTLAFGADLKNTIAVTRNDELFVSQYIGDLGTEKSLQAQERIARDLPQLLGVNIQRAACDRHPDHHSTRLAIGAGRGEPVCVQHHHAHIVACMAEHGLSGPVLGVSWDGTGYGDDGTIWGGEFLRADLNSFERRRWFRPFPLPGGEKAIREPRWTALGLLHAAEIDLDGLPLEPAFEVRELRLGRDLLEKQVNCPRTSSVGRLFDAVAALLGVQFVNSFEGEAAMRLEFVADDGGRGSGEVFPIELEANGSVDWRPLLGSLLRDLKRGRPIPELAALFHETMSDCIVRCAWSGELERVVLAGGCFQNRRLLETTVTRLREAGFQVFWPQALPTNDGGIAAGQAVVAGMRSSD